MIVSYKLFCNQLVVVVTPYQAKHKCYFIKALNALHPNQPLSPSTNSPPLNKFEKIIAQVFDS